MKFSAATVTFLALHHDVSVVISAIPLTDSSQVPENDPTGRSCDPNSLDPDIGILSCGFGYYCNQEDSLFGGICTPFGSDFADAEKKQRRLSCGGIYYATHYYNQLCNAESESFTQDFGVCSKQDCIAINETKPEVYGFIPRAGGEVTCAQAYATCTDSSYQSCTCTNTRFHIPPDDEFWNCATTIQVCHNFTFVGMDGAYYNREACYEYFNYRQSGWSLSACSIDEVECTECYRVCCGIQDHPCPCMKFDCTNTNAGTQGGGCLSNGSCSGATILAQRDAQLEIPSSVPCSSNTQDSNGEPSLFPTMLPSTRNETMVPSTSPTLANSSDSDSSVDQARSQLGRWRFGICVAGGIALAALYL